MVVVPVHLHHAGVTDVCAALRSRSIKIGSCTGFPMAVVDVLKEAAGAHGYRPDCYVAADEVPLVECPLPS